jgi:hypothetical protein
MTVSFLINPIIAVANIWLSDIIANAIICDLGGLA